MTAAWLLSAIASAVAYAFAATAWAQFAYRRKPHQALWALGLTGFALAAAIEAYASANPWTPGLYRAYFALAAANVGALGAGTVALAAPHRARLAAELVAAGVLVALFAPAALPLASDTPIDIDGDIVALADAGTHLGGKAVPFSNPGRIAFLALNVLGGLALIGGATLSWRRTRKPGVLLIALGALLPFAGGSASTLAGLDARVVLQTLGIGVMFAGFLLSRPAGTRVETGDREERTEEFSRPP